MTGPQTIEDIPWGDPPSPRLTTAKPRRCSHPKPSRVASVGADGMTNWSCGRCGHTFDPARITAGRRASRRGKDGERRVKARGGGERVGQFGGAADNTAVLGGFTVQTKSGPSYWPKGLARLLDAQALAAAATGTAGPAVCFVETGNRGRRNRIIFACYLDDLAAWSGGR